MPTEFVSESLNWVWLSRRSFRHGILENDTV
jgi:hypothetical protein